MPPKTKPRPSDETEPASKKQRKSSSPEPPSSVLTQQQEEEMSSAYIAQLLAQEGYDEHPYYSQYHRTKGRKRKGDTYKKTPQQQNNDDLLDHPNNGSVAINDSVHPYTSEIIPSKEKDGEGNNDFQETEINGEIKHLIPVKKQKKTPKTILPGMNIGAYSDNEETLFLSGLELYGRDWKKVQDSGKGYTLSGKELDPNSAAARPYLMRNPPQENRETVNKIENISDTSPFKTSNYKLDDTLQSDILDNISQLGSQPFNDEEKETSCFIGQEEQSKINGSDQVEEYKSTQADENHQIVTTEEKRNRGRPRTSPKIAQDTTKDNFSQLYGADGRTEYAKARLRGDRKQLSSAHEENADPLTMIKCDPFFGAPNSNIAGSQPFSMIVESNVLVAMDFHAHLMNTEVIGFLAGYWIPEKKELIVKATFPCRSLQTGENYVNVEMDPTSALEVQQTITDRDMQVVGWYHSHPIFQPDPSIVDLENQNNYQKLFRDEKFNEEPFVGAIVGPYDPKLPGSLSVINWFYVSNSVKSVDEMGQAKQLAFELVNNSAISNEVADEILDLVEQYRSSNDRVDFKEYWRKDNKETKLEKLIKSLAKRMPWLNVSGNCDNDDEQLIEETNYEMDVDSLKVNETLCEITSKQVTGDHFLERVKKLLKAW
ncbi:12482_t:CDS:2 [Funneliformis caledonium]|uniref:12482_t:CDS:1 n=1 Tax=Funneliformis caledonium TaxID=1117310 RepID=A0A9N8VV68_9GLOM|nr:12482_t:CDS:2 [Funneliformis caledonium]